MVISQVQAVSVMENGLEYKIEFYDFVHGTFTISRKEETGFVIDDEKASEKMKEMLAEDGIEAVLMSTDFRQITLKYYKS